MLWDLLNQSTQRHSISCRPSIKYLVLAWYCPTILLRTRLPATEVSLPYQRYSTSFAAQYRLRLRMSSPQNQSTSIVRVPTKRKHPASIVALHPKPTFSNMYGAKMGKKAAKQLLRTRFVDTAEAAYLVYASITYTDTHDEQMYTPAVNIVQPILGMIQCKCLSPAQPHHRSPIGTRNVPTAIIGTRNSGRPMLLCERALRAAYTLSLRWPATEGVSSDTLAEQVRLTLYTDNKPQCCGDIVETTDSDTLTISPYP